MQRSIFSRIIYVAVLFTLFTSNARAQKQEITVEEDIPYRKATDGVKAPDHWKLDLAMPKEGKGPFPLVICVHGGAWRAGNRKQTSTLMKQFAQRGFVSATISYRLVGVAKFPAQIEDCKAAVRFLRARAKKYRINPDKVGAIGFSAGGHLVSLMGVADGKAKLEGDGGNADQSSRVQAVVSFFGPTDFINKSWSEQVEKLLLVPFLGGSYKDAKKTYVKASPLTYVSKDDPPHLFFHGDKDTLVGIHHSKDMAAALKKIDVPAEVVVMEGVGHGLPSDSKKREAVIEQAIGFFTKKLAK